MSNSTIYCAVATDSNLLVKKFDLSMVYSTILLLLKIYSVSYPCKNNFRFKRSNHWILELLTKSQNIKGIIKYKYLQTMIKFFAYIISPRSLKLVNISKILFSIQEYLLLVENVNCFSIKQS